MLTAHMQSACRCVLVHEADVRAGAPLPARRIADTRTLTAKRRAQTRMCTQVVEVRARLQRALGRPLPLEGVSTLTLATQRELEAESGLTTRPGAAGGQVRSRAP